MFKAISGWEANENLLFSLTQNIRFLFELAYEDDFVFEGLVHFMLDDENDVDDGGGSGARYTQRT